MIPYDFTRHAERMFNKLPKQVQREIILKIEYYLSQSNPLAFVERISGSEVPAYRFRIRDYRVIFDWERNRVLITKVGHRRDVYQR